MAQTKTMFRVGLIISIFIAMVASLCVVQPAFADETITFSNGGTATLKSNGHITGRCTLSISVSGGVTDADIVWVKATMPDGQVIGNRGSGHDSCMLYGGSPPAAGTYDFDATPIGNGKYDVEVDSNVDYFGQGPGNIQPIGNLDYWEPEWNGWATVTKVSANPTVTNNNSNYAALETAVFTVYQGSTSKGTIRYRNGAWQELELPIGNYTMKETTVPTGYKTPNPNSKSFKVESSKTTTVVWANEPYTPRVQIIKTGSSGDANLDARVANNPYYDLSGAQFKLYKSKNINDPATNASGNQFTLTVSKQSDGSYKTNIETMPAGTYYVRETRAPNSGYLIDTDGDGTPDIEDADDNNPWRSITLPADDDVHTITWNDPPFFPEVDLTKYTSQLDMNLFEAVKDNPCYDILGAQFTLYEMNGTITKDIHGNNVVLTVDSSSEHGTVGQTPKIKILPGDYYLRETRAPNKGFKMDADGDGIADEVDRDTTGHKNVTVTLDDQTFTWTDNPLHDPDPLRLRKYDSKTGQYFKIPEGDADLNGAKYRVSYYKGAYTTVEQLPSTSDATAVWTTHNYIDADGNIYSGGIDLVFDAPSEGTWKYVSGEDNYIPLGTMVIQEVEPPTGYLIDPNKYIVTLTDDGTHLTMNLLHQPYQQDGTPGDDDWNNFANQYQLNGDQSGIVTVG